MSTGTNVSVLIDGVEAADGCNNDGDFEQPTILDNLTVTWGRSDTMSQPEPDTCSFEIMDVTGQGFTNRFRTGSRVDVLARGIVDGEASTPTFVNPGFETNTVTWATTGGTAARSTERSVSGLYSLNVRPSVSSAPVALLLAPAPFVAPGTDPDAWDDIPATELGQTWALNFSLWVPTGGRAVVSPLLFSGPYAAAGVPNGMPLVVTGNDEWQTFAIQHLVTQQATHWLGMQIAFSPIGRAWNEMPPTLTWDAVDPTLRWDDFGTMYVDDAQVTSPESPGAESVLVFSGRVTELSTSWDDSANAPVIAVTANGFMADLENRRVGDEPWDVESVDARAHRILNLAGLPITIDIDTSIDTTLLSWRDVDSQGALGLLHAVAVSVDAVLWPAVHSAIGAYLRMEDPALRAALLQFQQEVGPPPALLRTNLISNSSFETDTSGWALAVTNPPAVLVRRNDGPVFGTTYARVVTQLAGLAAALNGAGPNIIPISDNQTYVLSVYVRTRAGLPFNLRVTYSGGSAGAPLSPTFTGTGDWQRASWVVNTGTAGRTGMRCDIRLGPSGILANDYMDIDGWMLERASAVSPYFDGATPDTRELNYAFTGAANVSPSTESSVQTYTIIIVETDPDAGVNITACDVLRDPVTWIQSVADLATRVYVSWKQQGVDDEGLPTTTDVTEVEIDASLEQQHGTRSVSVSTELQSAADAQNVAQRVLTRTSSDAWRAGGLTIDDEDLTPGDDTEMLLFLLDGTSRIGLPIVFTDLPSWSPGGTRTGTYLEGGTYAFTGGRWVLQLTVSAANSGLGRSAAWDEMPSDWQWDEFDPSISWNDLRGVTV
jgi:hypothetical protein